MSRIRFCIIDGHGMIYRAVYRPGAPLTSPSGEPTRGTYTFIRMMLHLADTQHPDYMVMAMDAPRANTFRRKLYPGYKASRDSLPPQDESVVTQVNRIKELIDLLEIPTIEVDGFEADDVVASMVDVCARDDVLCLVCTSDKDLHQVVGENVVICGPDGKILDAAAVEQHWGVPPCRVVEVQTLMGDSTDDVPGVPGIGFKRARELIRCYGSVNRVVESRDDLSDSMQRSILATDLTLCRQLVELRTDVPLRVRLEDLEFNGFNMRAARSVFNELGFRL